jgi:hypothetical protein
MDRGVAQPGSAPRSGRGSRRFKSSRPDHTTLANTERLFLGREDTCRVGFFNLSITS